jgi:hypothetical protein
MTIAGAPAGLSYRPTQLDLSARDVTPDSPAGQLSCQKYCRNLIAAIVS